MAKASVKVEGIKELLEKLEKLENVGHDIKDKVGKECAEDMVKALKDASPVDKNNKGEHGKEHIKIQEMRTGYVGGSFFIDVGFKGKEFDKWRGAYFQNYLTDSKHYGWMTNTFKANRTKIRNKMKREISNELNKHL